MIEPILIIWIDDQFSGRTTRMKTADQIQKLSGGKLTINTVYSSEDKFTEWLESITPQSTPPDILIIDFRLLTHPKKHLSITLDDGYKLRDLLELTPLRYVPKYLVSAVLKKNAGPCNTGFDWMLGNPSDAELVSSQLISDGKDYRKLFGLTDQPHITPDLFLDLLLAPNSAHETLIDTLEYALDQLHTLSDIYEKDSPEPQDYNEKIKHTPLLYHFSKWIRGTLLIRNGPLIDDLSVANLLGSNLDYFNNALQSRFTQALYNGLFFRSTSPRWWGEEIITILLTTLDIDPGGVSYIAKQVADKLEIPDEKRSKCAVCHEPWPDVVASDIDDMTEVRQVHRRCSAIIERQPFLPGFNEARNFKV